MIKILVSGASGFIGANLIAKLSNLENYEAIEISSKNGNVSEPDTWKTLPATQIVVHLAARTFIPDSWADPAGFIRTNLIGTINALDYCRTHGARLIYVSSYLYGNPKMLPINENEEVNANNPYALSKKMAEEACQFYSQNYGISVTVLRPFNIFGAGQDSKFLIPSIIQQMQYKNVIKVKDLEPRRDYLYIDDLIEALICVINKPQQFEIYNIASGESYSVGEVIVILQEIMGKSVTILSEGIKRHNEIMDTRADISKAIQLLKWRPGWKFKEALTSVVQKMSSQ